MTSFLGDIGLATTLSGQSSFFEFSNHRQKKLLANTARNCRFCMGYQESRTFGQIFPSPYHYPNRSLIHIEYPLVIFYYIHDIHYKIKLTTRQSLIIPTAIQAQCLL